MRNLIFIGLFLASIGLYLPTQANAGIALPPLWENDLGDQLPTVSDCDDCEEAIVLPFQFPFNGSVFDMAYVGSNGCIQLGGLGLDDEIDYDHWYYMEDFLADSDPDNPEICPFNTDLSPEKNVISNIFYHSSPMHAVITWDRVASINDADALATFQILLYQDGRIVFNYNGILDGPGDDIIEDLENGIVVGVTPSDLSWDDQPFVPGDPGPVNLNQGPFNFGPTVYERWCYDTANSCGTDGEDTGLPGPINTAFDLDQWSVCFAPVGRGFSVSSGFDGAVFNCDVGLVTTVPTLSEWGLIAMAGVLGIIGLLAIRRRKATA